MNQKNYEQVDTIFKDETFTVLGKDQTEGWLQIAGNGTEVGWIRINLVDLNEDLGLVEVVEAPPLTAVNESSSSTPSDSEGDLFTHVYNFLSCFIICN